MKGYRVLYWGTMLCALLYGLYSGAKFSWLLFLVMALVLLAALGVNVWTVCSFSYIQELSAGQGEKGETVGLHIGIYNDKPFPFTRMRVTVEVPDPAGKQVLPIDLAPRAECSFQLSLSLLRRGEFLVGMTWLELQDVFGLLPMRFDLRRLPYYRQRPLLVLPRVERFTLSGGGLPQSLRGGLASAGDGQEEFSHLREWAPGDRLSRVHWAASAKTRTLFARQYQEPAGSSCLIFLDCRSLSDEAADRLAECAASLLYAHLDRGDPVRLAASHPQAQPLERAFSLTELTALRQWLALLKFDQKVSGREALAQALAGERYGRVYVLGGELDHGMEELLNEAEGRCCYWLAQPPAERGGENRRVRVAALGQESLLEFLYRNVGEEP